MEPLIIEVIGRYIELKQAGKEWRGLCPFHDEKTPSFYVNEGKINTPSEFFHRPGRTRQQTQTGWGWVTVR